MNTKIAESSKIGSTRQLVLEFGSDGNTEYCCIIEEKDLVFASQAGKMKVKRGGRDYFYNVYELGPILYDKITLRAKEDNYEKDKRYQEFLELKKEFEP